MRSAKMRLDQALADKSWTAATEQTGDFQSLPPAVILDVDDTVVNTSAYQAWTVVKGTSYSGKTWGAVCRGRAGRGACRAPSTSPNMPTAKA